ncbi:hypothetical protein [Nitratireductor rhodophyticola]|uniref:hypothetical protein n=1 Tax=Nitratireductor rhodophyticola TaxID=2854036 RepID=UPI003BA8DBBC
MKDLLLANWKYALSEVLASIIGTLGIVLAIAFILSRQTDGTTIDASFVQYFTGGQIGLPILSLSGIIFMALRKHGPLNPIVSVSLYVFLLGPIIITAFIIGLNPGFQTNVLSQSNLSLLWWLFFSLHVLWFVILILEPALPTAQEAGKEQDDRVNKIKAGAAGRA